MTFAKSITRGSNLFYDETMDYLHRLKNYCLDFIFPKSESLYELEAFSAGELVRLLPKARDIAEENLIVLFDYKNETVREMIWEIKYKGNRKIAVKIAEIVFDVLQHELAERAIFENFVSPILMPMPISNQRRRERGWNQTEILAEEILRLNNPKLFEYSPKVLIKHKHTDSQARTHATKRERMENLADSMSVINPEKIKNRCVILLDDVTTSGVTLAEARRVLKSAGAKKILCVALAH